MATPKSNTWSCPDSVAEQIRIRKNGNIVRWYVLTLPTSRMGLYQGNPALGLQRELERRKRADEPSFEFFAP